MRLSFEGVGVIYRIEYLASLVHEDIPELTKPIRKQIKVVIGKKLASHPHRVR